MTTDKIKVLVVDDTAFMRKVIPQVLESDPDVQVVGTAENGQEGLEMIQAMGPDVVTLDIAMPVMNGLTAIKHIMIKSPAPIVVLSSLVSDGAVIFEALRLGVVDFVPKPSDTVFSETKATGHHMIDRIKMACTMKLGNVRRVRLLRKWNVRERLKSLYKFYPLEYVIVIGTTLAGPNTVIRLLSKLSPTIPATVVVLQEISPTIISSFVKQFNEYVPWRVDAAQSGILLEQGTCYIGSNEQPLRLDMNEKGEICLKAGGSIQSPLNLIFSSAADTFQQNTIGVLLSGIGDDGAEGLGRIKENSGITMAKDTRCCVFPNLTDNAIRQGVVDMIMDDSKLPDAIESVMRGA